MLTCWKFKHYHCTARVGVPFVVRSSDLNDRIRPARPLARILLNIVLLNACAHVDIARYLLPHYHIQLSRESKVQTTEELRSCSDVIMSARYGESSHRVSKLNFLDLQNDFFQHSLTPTTRVNNARLISVLIFC